MTRDEAIDIIDGLYPPDSGYSDTAEIGRELLLSALSLEWRNLPDKTLFALCRLNEERERIADRHSISSHRIRKG